MYGDKEETASFDSYEEISSAKRAQIPVVSCVAASTANLGLWKKEWKQRAADDIPETQSLIA